MKLKLLFLLVVSFLVASCTSIPKGIEPVNNFDLNKYLGTWYEIARFDHSFEEGLERVTAEYTLLDDGGVRVTNRGFNPENNEWKEAEGKAYFVGEESTGHLKVSFFGPFYASYIIFFLDQTGYEYALVSGPNRDYLWILSREQELPKSTVEMLIQEASDAGFDTSKLIFVDHN
ncbi:lipocalin family protein [Aliiglaciecola sp. 3_MG-2023]|uniref:lipocalin family protein n=1 Tax=Aliiglaciecola sp. 3_MG-2023 TaxID=3062644 RepID=UPI0026E1316E|nr:lipocalin family protein [Aliiglaciecola sp. 3_MG-2023]MDO6694910.1 lipocalin family protein [Aliiglaciecola sp. 3_MG-2023]